MKSYLKKLLANKTYFVLFIIILFFLPVTLALPAQSEVRAIVIGLGIDLETVEEALKANQQSSQGAQGSGSEGSSSESGGENGEAGENGESGGSSTQPTQSGSGSENNSSSPSSKTYTNNYKLSAQIIIPTISFQPK